MNQSSTNETQNTIFTATLGGGCYWCLEAMFGSLKGITGLRNGFSGGITEAPSYESVCAGNTGHIEVVQFDYNPEIINYIEVLKLFFTLHNPTTRDQQGSDVGSQYRSAVFFHDNYQRLVAEEMIKYLEKEKIWQNIVTEILPFEAFYEAPKKHHRYFDNHSDENYCQMVIEPKLAKFRELFADKLK